MDFDPALKTTREVENDPFPPKRSAEADGESKEDDRFLEPRKEVFNNFKESLEMIYKMKEMDDGDSNAL